MATVIPTYTPRQPLEIGGGVQTGGVEGVSAGVLSGFGGALSDLAAGLQAGWASMKPVEAEANFQAFQLAENKLYNDTVFATKPEASEGFATNYEGEFTKRSGDWLTKNTAGMTPKQQASYQARMIELQTGIYGNALKFEREQQFNYSKNQLDKTVQGVFLPRAETVAALPDDENKPLELAKLEADADKAIDENPALSEADKFKQKELVRSLIQLKFAKSLPLGDQANLDPNRPVDTVARRIVAVEGAGRNPASSAEGKGQFIADTWVDLVKRYRPALAEGKSRDEILALRTDPRLPLLGQEMVRAYAAENSAYLKTRGISVDAGNIYLAHFLGPKGAATMLTADPSQSAAEINPSAAKANPSVFYAPGDDGRPDLNQPRSVADLQRWAGSLMAGTKYTDWRSLTPAVTDQQRAEISMDAAGKMVTQQKDAALQAKAVYDQRLNAAENGAVSGSFGMTDLGEATKTWLTDATDRKKILDTINKYQGDNLKLAADTALFVDTSRPIDTFLKAGKDSFNNVYEKSYGGGANLLTDDGQSSVVLRGFVERSAVGGNSGYIPDAGVARLSDGIYSDDKTQRQRAFQIMDGLKRGYPSAYNRAFKEGDQKRLDIYQALAGIVPEDVLEDELNPMVDSQTIKLRDERGAKGLTAYLKDKADGGMSKILDSFDPSGMPFGIGGGDPSAPHDTIAQDALLRDYHVAIREAAERVPADKVEETALGWIKNRWGKTDAGPGGQILMAYPPEQKYNSVGGSHAWIDDQLTAAVGAQFPGAQSWTLVSGQQTEADVSAKQPPHYRVHVVAADGTLGWLSAPIMRAGIGSDAAAKVEYSAAPAWIAFDYRQAKQEYETRTFAQRAISEALSGIVAPPNEGPARELGKKLLAPGDPNDPMFRSFRGNPSNPMGRQLGPVPFNPPPAPNGR